MYVYVLGMFMLRATHLVLCCIWSGVVFMRIQMCVYIYIYIYMYICICIYIYICICIGYFHAEGHTACLVLNMVWCSLNVSLNRTMGILSREVMTHILVGCGHLQAFASSWLKHCSEPANEAIDVIMQGTTYLCYFLVFVGHAACTPWEDLGLHPNAPPADVRKAYCALALKWHPDEKS